VYAFVYNNIYTYCIMYNVHTTYIYIYAYIIPGRWIFACIAPMGIAACSGCWSNAAYGNIWFDYNKILCIRSKKVKITVKTDSHYQYYDRLQLIDHRRPRHGVAVWSIILWRLWCIHCVFKSHYLYISYNDII